MHKIVIISKTVTILTMSAAMEQKNISLWWIYGGLGSTTLVGQKKSRTNCGISWMVRELAE